MSKKHRQRPVSVNKKPIPANLNVNPQLIAIMVLVVAAVAVIAWMIMASQTPAGNRAKQYASAPPMLIDKNKPYTATVKLAKGGAFVIQLYAAQAPLTVNNFVFLAREGYYNGVTFHRVLEGFMAQGGDPTGTGGGGPGYTFADETNNGLTFDTPGLVAMANSGPNTNGSQFFITYAKPDWLNGKHTIFGKVISGAEAVNGLRRRNPDTNPDYPGDAMESVTITEQ